MYKSNNVIDLSLSDGGSAEGVKWDDMKAPATALNPAGRVRPPDTDEVDGTLLFDIDETIATWFQLPHAWVEGSELRPHIHWMKTTSESGYVDWRISYKWADVGEVMPSLSAQMAGTGGVSDDDTVDKHALMTFAPIDGTGKGLSSMLCIVLERVSTNDTYGEDARLLEIDIHYQLDSNGSTQEYVK